MTFPDFFNDHSNFCGFSFQGITTQLNKQGVEKKKIINMTNWKQINRKNYKQFIKPSHKGFAVITGKLSGITVFDFDDRDVYNQLVKEHSELTSCFTVETKNGFHIYFEYDREIKTTTNGMIELAGIDIRNDDSIVFCPPTSYKKINGETFEYEFKGGEIIQVPEYLKSGLKQFGIEGSTDSETETENETENENYEKKMVPAHQTNQKEMEKLEFFVEHGCKISSDDCEHKDLVKVGYALYNMFGRDGLGIYLKFSELNNDDSDTKHDTYRYLHEFCKTTQNVSIGTIYYLFKQNDEQKYRIVLQLYNATQCKSLDSEAFSSSLVADIFKAIHGDKFVYCHDQLYHFNGVYWEADDKQNSKLTVFIDKVFIPELLKLAAPITQHYKDLETDTNCSVEDSKDNKKKKENFEETVRKIYGLKNVSMRQNAMKDIIVWITDNSIEFDSKTNLFAFNNKIFDLNQGVEIAPNHLDYVSTTCGYDYDTTYNNVQYTAELMEIINSIFPIEQVRDYYLSVLATGLGGIQMENLFIASGEGGNGKSLINSLMLKTCGTYGYKLASSALTQPIKDGANPQMAQLDNKRFVLTQEPDRNKRQCCSTIKEITGDQTLNVRDHYSSKCGITLRMTLLQECNDKPKLDETGEAMLRRIRVIPFTSTAVAKEDYETLQDKTGFILINTFYKTEAFRNKYKQAFFEILKNHYTLFQKNKFSLGDVPQECKQCAVEYLVSSDDLFTWFQDFYTLDETSKNVVDIKEVFDIFKTSEYYSNLSKADKRQNNLGTFRKKMEKNIFLKKYIKKRDQNFNGAKLKKACVVVNWVLQDKEASSTCLL